MINNPDILTTIKFPLGLSLIIAAIVATLTFTFYYFSSSPKETVIFFAAASTAGATIATAFYTAKSLQHVLAARAQDISLEMKRRALAYGERWNDPSMKAIRATLSEINQMKARGETDEAICKFATENSVNVNHVLNFWEELAFSIENGLVDRQMVREQFEGLVVTLWLTLKTYVVDHRSKRQRPRAFKAVENLYEEWTG